MAGKNRTGMQSRWLGGSLQICPPIVAGSAFFVDSNVGSDTGNSGTDWDNALATIDAAINKCTDDKGDIVYVHPAHTETLSGAADLDIDVDSVSVIGVVIGNQKPTVTIGGTDAATTVEINGNKILLKGIRFVGGDTDGSTTCLNIVAGSDYVTVEDCDFTETVNTAELLGCIDIAATCEWTTIRGCVFQNLLSGDNTHAIKTASTTHDFLTIEDCTFFGDWSAAPLDLDAGAIVQPLIRNCTIINLDGTGAAVLLDSGTKCVMVGLRVASAGNAAYPISDKSASYQVDGHGCEVGAETVALLGSATVTSWAS